MLAPADALREHLHGDCQSARVADAPATIDDVLERLVPALDAIALPQARGGGAAAGSMIASMLSLCRARVAAFD